MGNNSNDDRSNSMNPNNSQYWASVENNRNQTGDYDEAEIACVANFDTLKASSFIEPIVQEEPMVFVVRAEPKRPEREEHKRKLTELINRVFYK